MRSSADVNLPIQLDRSGDPLPSQLAHRLRVLISDAVLAPGDTLPSTRALAAHLAVSRGTVVAAYDQLLAEGYLSASAGRSTQVNPLLRRSSPRSPHPHRPVPAEPCHGPDLRPGRPWADGVVGPAWRAAWRQASAAPVDQPAPAMGLPALRAAWCEHLRRSRAVARETSQIAVTAGGREGFALVLHALAGDRPLRVAVEDPGYPSLRRVPGRFGASVLPLPVDEHGLRVADLPTGREAPDLLLVTPSHQYPLGGSLPMDRRQALLEWARQNRVLIVEDDYDSELRYTSQPLPALAALDDPDEGVVALLGTLSKTLTPTLSMGFLTLPFHLVPAVAAAREDLGQPVGVVPQRAVTSLLEAGALRSHTHRMRERYRRRRTLLMAALADVPGITVLPMDGGLHAVVQTQRPEHELVAALARSGIRVSPLADYWSGSGSPPGIVFGLGTTDKDRFVAALALIAREAAG